MLDSMQKNSERTEKPSKVESHTTPARKGLWGGARIKTVERRIEKLGAGDPSGWYMQMLQEKGKSAGNFGVQGKLYKKCMVHIQSELLEASSLRGPRAMADQWRWECNTYRHRAEHRGVLRAHSNVNAFHNFSGRMQTKPERLDCGCSTVRANVKM